MKSEPPAAASVRKLMRRYALASRRKRVWLEDDLLALVEEHGVEPLLRESAYQAQHFKNTSAILCFVWLVLVLAPIMVGLPLFGSIESHLLLSFVAAAGLARLFLGMRRSQQALVRLLARCHDKRAVGLLADALLSDDKRIRASGRFGLTGLLPTLLLGDGALLTRTQRETLHAELRQAYTHREPEFAVAILTGLSQIGDGGALQQVRRIASGGFPLLDRFASKSVEEKAREWLPVLERNVVAASAQNELLRAACEGTTAEAELLRIPAADPGGEADLLQAAEAPHGQELKS